MKQSIKAIALVIGVTILSVNCYANDKCQQYIDFEAPTFSSGDLISGVPFASSNQNNFLESIYFHIDYVAELSAPSQYNYLSTQPVSTNLTRPNMLLALPDFIGDIDSKRVDSVFTYRC